MNSTTSFGSTGTIKPSASMSSTTVMKMKTTAAGRPDELEALDEILLFLLEAPRRETLRLVFPALPLLAQAGQLRQVVGGLLSGGRVPLLEQRHHHLLHEPGLALGRHLVHAQVASLDPEAHEPGG